jgi:hypothetical protein
VTVDLLTIEHDAGAGPQGTEANQLQRALGQHGVATSTDTSFPANCTTVMNPIGGRVLTDVGDYGRAYWGVTINVAAASTLPRPAPAPRPGLPADAYPQNHVSFAVTVMTTALARRGLRGANTHRNPHLASPVLRVVPRGARLVCDGYDYSDAVDDYETGLPDRRWYHLAPGSRVSDPEWVASAIVDGNAPGSHR